MHLEQFKNTYLYQKDTNTINVGMLIISQLILA